MKGKTGVDSFIGSNLQKLLKEKNIETVMIGGFLTNCCVESTMRTAYDKGYNVITLTDGTACNSQAEHLAATEVTFKMFSTPMTCKQAADILKGTMPKNLDNILSQHDASIRSLQSNPESIRSLKSHPEPESQGSISEFAKKVMDNDTSDYGEMGSLLTMEEARKDINEQYETTQVFIAPGGDWTKRVAKEITDHDQLRSCWVRGPYSSPYAIASHFNHLILVASGIGITPALGVMGQFPGVTRTKFLIWSTRSPEMLKFFAPLLRDAHVAGKETDIQKASTSIP